MTSVLIVVTGADHWTLNDGTKHPTGFWAEELAVPHRLFREAGYDITVVTPGGVVPTVDRASLTADANGGEGRAAEIAAYLDSISGELERPGKLEKVDASDFDAVFYPGGHGPLEDLADNPASGALLSVALGAGTPLAVLCHAPAALLAARTADGGWPFTGYRMTGFTDAEEAGVGLADKAPWLVQDRLTERGADFVEAEPFTPHVVTDRNLLTGQNPASSEGLARELIGRLPASGR